MEIKTTGFTKMTKAELIETIKAIQEAYQELKDLLDQEMQKKADAHKSAQAEIKELRQQIKSQAAGSDTLNELQQRYKKLETVYGELLESYNRLKKEVESRHASQATDDSDHRLLLELRNSFFESDSVGQILIDAKYVIQCVNQLAVHKLAANQSDELVHRKIFDFFDYDNGVKLKKRIDRVLLEGDSEKIKDIHGKSASGQLIKTKGKIKPIRFKNQPAALIRLK